MSSSRSKVAAPPYAGPSWYRAAIYLAIALLAQVSFLHYLSIRGHTIGPVLVVVVWYAIHADPRRAATIGLIAGALEDLLSTGTGGGWTIATTVTAVLASVLSRGFFSDSMPLVAGIVIFATVVRSWLFWLIMGLQGYPPGLGWRHFHDALWQAALNAVLVVAAMLIGRYRESPSHR